MALISDEDINRVREATDAVALVGEYVQLRRRGRDMWGCCPFHHEKTPSFKVSPQTQRWHCFGCGMGGDVFKFLMLKEQFDFPEAVRYLADKAHITITEQTGGMPTGYRARLLAVCDETATFYHSMLMRGRSEDCDQARAYLKSRGLGGDVPNKWNLGFAPGGNSLTRHLKSKGFTQKEMVDANVALVTDRGGLRDRFYRRVMFPIRDLQGRTIAFGGRVMGSGEPKYINTSNCPLFSKRNNLFGIDFAKSSIVVKGTAVVVEGYTDVIAMHEAGFDNVVATLGTALTPQHVKLLTRFASDVVYLFDGDAAGQNAADRAAELITSAVTPESGSQQVQLKVAVIPNNMDPAEFVADGGTDAMAQLLQNAQPLLRFVIDRRLSMADLTSPESRARALPRVLEPLVPIRDSILADEYVNYLADIFKVDFARMRRELDNAPMPRNYIGEASDDSFDQWQTGDTASGAVNVQAQPLQPAVQQFAIPATGVGRWEAQLLCAYALQPQVRMSILQGMRGESWCNTLYESCMQLMESMGTDARPADMVSACIAAQPASEPIWNMELPGFEDARQAQASVMVMLDQRKVASLQGKIADMESAIKYGNLSQEQADAMFARIVELQKQLSVLRRS